MIRRAFPIAIVTAVALAAAVASQAGASSQTAIRVAGTFKLVKPPTGPCTKAASRPWLLTCHQHGGLVNYSGGLNGSAESTFTSVLDCKKGETWGSGTETFTGSVAGVGSGTLVWDVHFASGVDCVKGSLESFSATVVVTSGSGDLAQLRGSMYRIADNTYTGRFH